MTTIHTTKDPITLTKRAAVFVKQALMNHETAKGVRIGVKKSGCSGLSYVIDYSREAFPEDLIYESEGVQLMVDPKSLIYLKGLQIDCVTEGLNQVLTFINPNAIGACGCGESFTVSK